MLKTFSLFTLLIVCLISCDCGEKKKDQKTQASSKLLDSLFTSAVTNHEVPAAAALLMHKGNIVYHEAFGWKNIEEDEAIDKTDLFRIASMTKSVTAVGILQLVQRGLIFLDDPVSKFIPEFKNPVVLLDVLPDSSFTSRPAEKEIKIWHLLTHTSGIGYGFQSDMYNALVIKNGISEGFEERPINTQENIRRIAKLPLLHDPGEKFTYSLSFDVLGAVIEVVSGQRLDAYFNEHIFKPLGMDETHFYLPEEKYQRLATVYEYNQDKTGFIPTTYEMTEYPVQGAQTYMSGGADLSSTVEDIGIFAQMLLNKGEYKGVRILGSRYVEMMTSRQSEHGWWDSDIGFGVSVVTEAGAAKKVRNAGSFDFGGFYDTWCWIDRENEMVGILFLQMYPGNEYRIHEKFLNITYGITDNY